MTIETRALGGEGGKPFDIEAIQEVGVRSGERIDALFLNGDRHGGGGGKERERFTLLQDEYIEYLAVRHGRKIDRLEFRTNFGRHMKHGGGGGKQTVMENIRVLGLGGRSGNELDKLRIHYIKDYTPSQIVEGRQTAVIGIVPPGEQIETFVSSRVSRLNSTRRLFETTFSAEQSSGAEASFGAGEGEFVAKTNRTFGFTQTSTREFINQIQTEEVDSETRTRSPETGFAGLEVVQVEVFKVDNKDRGLDDAYWVYPVAEPEYIEVREEIGIPPQLSVLDMTGVMALQLPVMASRQEIRFGRDFYAPST